jgi:transposase
MELQDESRTDTQRIKPEVKIKLNKVAFYLSKIEHQGLFDKNLNQGETIRKIAAILGVKVNTLKNKRDQYDPYCSNTRVGWVQQANLSDDMQQVFEQYKNKPQEDIKEEIINFFQEL